MALRLLVGIAAAALCLALAPRIEWLARQRPGFVPVAMAVLLGGLLHPRVRHWFIISLCFSVSLLAVKDMLRTVPMPPQIDWAASHAAYPVVWLLVAVLAAAAGVLEALHPGSVAARRCYFATAAVYFTGHGFTGFLWEGNWQTLAALAIGVVASLGAVFAHRLDANTESPVSEDVDEARAAKTREKVAAREWHEAEEIDSLHAPNRS